MHHTLDSGKRITFYSYPFPSRRRQGVCYPDSFQTLPRRYHEALSLFLAAVW